MSCTFLYHTCVQYSIIMKIYREYRHITGHTQRRVCIVTMQLCCPTGSVSGIRTMLLWRATYASELASWRTRLLVVGDWGKSYVFGRDSSCMINCIILQQSILCIYSGPFVFDFFYNLSVTILQLLLVGVVYMLFTCYSWVMGIIIKKREWEKLAGNA